ncbi:hypothetical protein ACFQY5_25775 [Paeniroseomonas aquatica]|uniref:glycosyltransferase family A protein n=1 Tax=Paeniroseomonas aquatica TaxID=373043 RepID=UPI00361757A9
MPTAAAPLVAARDWSIVVLARGEAATLARCLDAIGLAAAGHDAQVTVLLNGPAGAGIAAAERFAAGGGPRLRLFHIPHADRANAWNQYVHGLRPEAAMHVFTDAHAAVTPGTLRSLAAALAEDPSAEAATALPSTGRHAAAMRARLRSGGALHGSLHALRGRFLEDLARRGLRLPVGLGRSIRSSPGCWATASWWRRKQAGGSRHWPGSARRACAAPGGGASARPAPRSRPRPWRQPARCPNSPRRCCRTG